MFVPLSIPSPSVEWQYFDLTSWINSTFGAELPGQLRIHAYALFILVGIVAAVLYSMGRKQLKQVDFSRLKQVNPMPERTMETLQQVPGALKPN